MAEYIIGIDQSTQGTKALLFDEQARLLDRTDLSHKQKVSAEGYISHDPEEIYQNTIAVVRKIIEKSGIMQGQIRGIGISNQRETTVAWNRETKAPLCDAVVWQCSRAKEICTRFGEVQRQTVISSTGIPLSPYFPAAKMAWILEHYPEAVGLQQEGRLCLGTMDSFLLYRLSGGKEFKTDYSNASRTQLFNLHTLGWDEEICEMFGIQLHSLPKVCDSNSLFGMTDLDGYLHNPVPVHAIMGDSHGALFGQGCHKKGMVKATYGTGSSLMMNIGESFAASRTGLVTSLAWGIDGRVNYVLEGNLNYTGAVITWLKDDVKLISSAEETQGLALEADPKDTSYLVPAFSGLGAPYWNSEAKAMLCGMSRRTGRAEIVKAALDCIAYQITDILLAMEQDSGTQISALSVDGGPTKNRYLMQLQSDMADVTVRTPDAEELSGIGAAYLAGITMGVFTTEQAFGNLHYQEYQPGMDQETRNRLYHGWKEAVGKVLESV